MAMPYSLDTREPPDGYYVVHGARCPQMPGSAMALGSFDGCEEAVNAARRIRAGAIRASCPTTSLGGAPGARPSAL
jgi:hypothetical protein